jgi:predicted nucleic acid-binding protein
MTGNKILLDTNIVIEVFEGNILIAGKLHKLSRFCISSVVLGELYIGVHRVVNKAKHLKKLNDFCGYVQCLMPTAKLTGIMAGFWPCCIKKEDQYPQMMYG